jgi:hypothetical protein
MNAFISVPLLTPLMILIDTKEDERLYLALLGEEMQFASLSKKE